MTRHHPSVIRAALDRLVDTMRPGDYTTLDCRAGVHGGCETCACNCHQTHVCSCIRGEDPSTVAVPDPHCGRRQAVAQ